METTAVVLEKSIKPSNVLVTDSSLRVLGLVPTARAVKLLFSDKAYVLVPRSDGLTLRSPSKTLDTPVAIALNRYVQDRRKVFTNDDYVSKRVILRRDGYICAYCGEYGDTIDHIVPRARGGRSTWGNMTAACRDCNSRKADKPIEVVGYRKPVIPSSLLSFADANLQNALYARLEMV